MTHFEQLDLSKELMRGLDKMGFTSPTPVQAASISPMLEGKDLLVQAPTGTGKTCAFGIPAIEGIDPRSRHIQAVILCPTRELAIQTADVIKKLVAYKPGIKVAALYGGEPIQRQITGVLRRRPQIVVATPGRMIDHIRRRTARLKDVNLIVLDEADRMLDMGFREDMDTILQSVPTTRQTVLFSATLSKEIQSIAALYQTDAERITIEQETLTVDRIEQFYSEIRGRAKTPALLQLLGEKKFGLSLVFVSTKAMADSLARELTHGGFPAEALHGDLRQKQRDKVMQQYRNGTINILVATDVAARGIDVNNIDAVINYDIPGDAESYVHRIGRTGRANQSGIAYTFIYPKEREKLHRIMTVTRAAILPFVLLGGKQPDFTGKKPYYSQKAGHSGKSAGSSRSRNGGQGGRKFYSNNGNRSRQEMRQGA